VFNLEQNLGLAGARNFGIKKAKGQFIIFLDADDYLHNETLRMQKVFLEENNNLDAVSVDYYLVDERGKHIEHVTAAEKPIACGIMFRKDFAGTRNTTFTTLYFLSTAIVCMTTT
jgi:glycosyltransferase involved in cell wall biosynthesis